MKSVLVACEMHRSFIYGLENAGFKCDYRPKIGNSELSDIISAYTGIVVSTRILLDRDKINQAESLKFIARAGSGMEKIDHEYAGRKGIRCFNSPEGNRDAVAEHAVGMILALLNHIVISDNEIRKSIWHREPNRGNELKGKTIGIIGYGNNGSALARRLQGFDMQILAYDKYKNGFSNDHVTETGMKEIFREADILSLHIPLTNETRMMVDWDYVSSFEKPIYLINTARGKIVNIRDLIEMLDEKVVLGACLDVLEDENIQKDAKTSISWYHELVRRNDVILTPHVAGWTHESKERIGTVLLEKITSTPLGS